MPRRRRGPRRTLDASTLGAACVNVGMIAEDAFSSKKGLQEKKIEELAGIVMHWLSGGSLWSA